MMVLWIGFFGVFGVLARYGTTVGIGKWLPHSFPFATFGINIAGSLLAGALYVLGSERVVSLELRVALMVGFLGGFTTFSSFSLEAVRLIEEGAWSQAMLYLFGSPVLGAAAAALGIWLARRWVGLG